MCSHQWGKREHKSFIKLWLSLKTAKLFGLATRIPLKLNAGKERKLWRNDDYPYRYLGRNRTSGVQAPNDKLMLALFDIAPLSLINLDREGCVLVLCQPSIDG